MAGRLKPRLIAVSYNTAEFPPIVIASEKHRWRGQSAAGKPIVRVKDGSICIPLSRYFGKSLLLNRVAVSSMQGEAYILREWWAYLDAIDCDWEDANDQIMLDWLAHLKGADAKRMAAPQNKRKSEDAHNNRLRKLEVVFNFYKNAETRTSTTDGPSIKTGYQISKMRLVSPSGPITSTWQIPSKRGRRGIGRRAFSEPRISEADVAWAYAAPYKEKHSRRPTPNDEGIAKVVSALRSRLVGVDASPRRGRPTCIYLPERDYLIGKLGIEGGLRAAEIASFSVRRLAHALTQEGIAIPNVADLDDIDSDRPRIALSPLDALAYSVKGQQQIIAALEHRKRQHYQYIWVEVTGKGAKTRAVPLPIVEVIELLTIGVWQIRKLQIASGASRILRKPATARPTKSPRNIGPPADQLILGAGTTLQKGLKPATIGRVLKAAFKAAGVTGSAHDLRHYFATKTCARLWAEAFALNGFRWDQTVETFVLDQLAQAMGHTTVEVALRTYLDKELMRSMGLKDKTALGLMRKTSMLISENSMRLSKADFERLNKIITSLSADDARTDGFTAVVDALLADASLVAAEPTVLPAARQRHLRLIMAD